jgi:hypothetical protein
MLEEKGAIGKIVKFSTVITLYESDRKKEVSVNITLKVNKNCVHIRFVSERKGPCKMCKIIQDDKIIFETRNT